MNYQETTEYLFNSTPVFEKIFCRFLIIHFLYIINV